MANRLQTIIPAQFQPTDPADVSSGQAGRLSSIVAIALAVLVVGLIAVLMGMT
jgi:hypothetical protein